MALCGCNEVVIEGNLKHLNKGLESKAAETKPAKVEFQTVCCAPE